MYIFLVSVVWIKIFSDEHFYSILYYSIFSLFIFFDVDICDILHFIKEREENAVAAESCDWWDFLLKGVKEPIENSMLNYSREQEK